MHATLSKMVALSMAAMSSWCWLAVLVCLCGPSSLPWNLVFCSLSPLQSQDNSGCVASAHNMHLLGRSNQVVPRVCFFQKLIQDGIISAQQSPTAVRIPDIGTKALPRVPFESFTDQLLSDRHVAANNFHLALPTPVRLLIYSSCFSCSRWCMCFYPINVSYLLHCCLYLSLQLSSKGGCAQCQDAWILRSR